MTLRTGVVIFWGRTGRSRAIPHPWNHNDVMMCYIPFCIFSHLTSAISICCSFHRRIGGGVCKKRPLHHNFHYFISLMKFWKYLVNLSLASLSGKS